MKINIKATGIELTPAISDYVHRKLSSIEKYLGENDDTVAQVEVGRITQHHRTGEVFKAEVHLAGQGIDLYAVEEGQDVLAAIDAVKDEISTELRRMKGKKMALMRRGGLVVKNMMKGFYSGVSNIKKFRFRGRR